MSIRAHKITGVVVQVTNESESAYWQEVISLGDFAKLRTGLPPMTERLYQALHAWDTSIAWAHEAEEGPGDRFERELHEAYDEWEKSL